MINYANEKMPTTVGLDIYKIYRTNVNYIGFDNSIYVYPKILRPSITMVTNASDSAEGGNFF